jgi:hypothetical protein
MEQAKQTGSVPESRSFVLWAQMFIWGPFLLLLINQQDILQTILIDPLQLVGQIPLHIDTLLAGN